MKFTFDQAVRNFHQRIAFAANRWNTGIQGPEDVYQEVLMALCSYDFPKKRTWCIHSARWVDYDPSYVNRFIDSRAKDVVRKENYRQTVRKASDARLEREKSRLTNLDLGIDLQDALASLSAFDRDVILLLVLPDKRISESERRRGVTLEQVGRVLGVSKASVSRAAERARSTVVAKLSA